MKEITLLRWLGMALCGLTIVAAVFWLALGSERLGTATMVFLCSGLVATVSSMALGKLEARAR